MTDQSLKPMKQKQIVLSFDGRLKIKHILIPKGYIISSINQSADQRAIIIRFNSSFAF